MRSARPMPLDPNDNYTNSALRVGDVDPYPQRLVGEFIGTVVSNDVGQRRIQAPRRSRCMSRR